MDSQNHFSGLRLISKCLILIAKPQKLIFPIPLTDIDTELDQRLINDIFKCIRLRGVRSALDRYRPLVVGIGRRTP